MNCNVKFSENSDSALHNSGLCLILHKALDMHLISDSGLHNSGLGLVLLTLGTIKVLGMRMRLISDSGLHAQFRARFGPTYTIKAY